MGNRQIKALRRSIRKEEAEPVKTRQFKRALDVVVKKMMRKEKKDVRTE